MSQWRKHGQINNSKSKYQAKVLYRKQKYLNIHTKKLLVKSLIQCLFDYACSFGTLDYRNFLDKMMTKQNNKVCLENGSPLTYRA